MSVLRETYSEKTECNFLLPTPTERSKNKGLESSRSSVKERSKAISQGKRVATDFYLQASVEFIRACSRRKVPRYESRGGALACCSARAGAQFSRLHILRPGNCLRNSVVKKRLSLLTDGFDTL